MAGEMANLVATDPPYLVDYSGERPNDSGKDWSATYKEVDITDAEGFFRSTFTNILSVLAPNAAIYCWHAHKRSGLIQRIWEELGIVDHQQIVWIKPASVFGRVYWHFRHEPCMMGWRQGDKPAHDGNHQHDSVWAVDWEGKSRIVGNEHPTQKPVEIFARPIRKHTKRGDICFEPFAGSGSQIIAAEMSQRRCFALHLVQGIEEAVDAEHPVADPTRTAVERSGLLQELALGMTLGHRTLPVAGVACMTAPAVSRGICRTSIHPGQASDSLDSPTHESSARGAKCQKRPPIPQRRA